VPELVAALSAGRLVGHDWKATLAGDGNIGRFKQEAEQRGIGGRVSFPGWLGRDATAALLASGDIFVLPSHHEGLPVAVLEALAHGLATIATPVGSLPEFLVDRKSVIFVPPANVDKLIDALEHEVRCVRIIHGKGLRSGHRGPVLKAAVNAVLRRTGAVLAYVSARPVDGGTGAVYVLLS